MKRLIAIATLAGLAVMSPGAGAGAEQVRVVCVKYDGTGGHAFKLHVKPRKCTWVVRGDEPFGYNTVDMARIDWKSWGSRRARGRGKFLVNMAGPIPGRVKLSKPRAGCNGRPSFTKATFYYPQTGSKTDMRLDACR